jgi:tripartite-type tricarboxylate transporter receptor subunit TctC
MPVGIAHVRSGKLRALAMTSEKRSPQAPDLPTFVESGVPGFISESWWGIIGPRGMPRAAVAKMSDAIGRIVAEPEIKERFAGLGIDPFPMSASDFGAYMRSEIVRYGKLIADAGIPKE